MKNRILLILVLMALFVFQSQAQIAATKQGFDDINHLPGWLFINQSNPIGINSWFQGSGNLNVMTAQEGNSDSFIAANFNSTGGESGSPGTICNFLIMPDIGDLESVSFYTRSRIANNNFNVFPDRLYMVYSPTGEINPGNCIDGFGDFTEVLQVVNPDLLAVNIADNGYPLTDWLQFSSEINGAGRIAFVYYVPDAGLFGNNSNYIGIDTVEWVLATDEPVPQVLFSTGFEF